jgi:hypothetical protein
MILPQFPGSSRLTSAALGLHLELCINKGDLMKSISTLLLLMILMGVIGCDNEDPRKPVNPPPTPSVPTPQVK